MNARFPIIAATLLAALPAVAQTQEERQRESEKTEVWEPVPPTVDTENVPSDAVVLFDGTDLSAWDGEEGGAPTWKIDGDTMTVDRKGGGIRTKDSFCDVQLHVEWRSPVDIAGMDGQDRGNSGIFLQDLYEIQILDSHDNPTYANGQAASIYKQHIPLVNASRPPGEWQSYDIIFTAPRFDDDKALVSPAYATVLHNGVLVQNHVEIQGATEWIGAPDYDQAHGCAPIFLQNHDAAVSFRNIWVRNL